MTKAQKKNAQKRQKKKEKRQKETGFEIEEMIEGFERARISSDTSPKQLSVPEVASRPLVTDQEDITTNKEQVKRIRTLGKKLHQIDELERRIETGEIPKPDKDQLRKIANKEQLLEEMESLQLAKE